MAECKYCDTFFEQEKLMISVKTKDIECRNCCLRVDEAKWVVLKEYNDLIIYL